MSVLHLDSQNFEEILKSSDKPFVVDFWAEWCMPCKMFGPVFEEAAEKLSDTAMFAKVNVDQSEDVALKYSIRSIPTVVLFKNSVEVARQTGALSVAELSEFINQI